MHCTLYVGCISICTVRVYMFNGLWHGRMGTYNLCSKVAYYITHSYTIAVHTLFIKQRDKASKSRVAELECATVAHSTFCLCVCVCVVSCTLCILRKRITRCCRQSACIILTCSYRVTQNGKCVHSLDASIRLAHG